MVGLTGAAERDMTGAEIGERLEDEPRGGEQRREARSRQVMRHEARRMQGRRGVGTVEEVDAPGKVGIPSGDGKLTEAITSA